MSNPPSGRPRLYSASEQLSDFPSDRFTLENRPRGNPCDLSPWPEQPPGKHIKPLVTLDELTPQIALEHPSYLQTSSNNLSIPMLPSSNYRPIKTNLTEHNMTYLLLQNCSITPLLFQNCKSGEDSDILYKCKAELPLGRKGKCPPPSQPPTNSDLSPERSILESQPRRNPRSPRPRLEQPSGKHAKPYTTPFKITPKSTLEYLVLHQTFLNKPTILYPVHKPEGTYPCKPNITFTPELCERKR